jgi:hypothetical protein
MPTGLAISSVTLSRRRRALPDPVDGHREIWFDVSLVVKNLGDIPLHVIDELRGLIYDAPRRMLTLRLREPAPTPVDKNAPTFHLPTPHTVTVAPGATVTIVVAIPAVLRTLRQGPDLSLVMEKTDLRGMETIRSEIAASAQPIEFRPVEKPHALRTRLASWGKIVTTDTAVKPDTRDALTDEMSDAESSKNSSNKSKKR